MKIWNMNGKLVDTCKPENYLEGSVVFMWDGKGLHGKCVFSGVYILTIKAGSISTNYKISCTYSRLTGIRFFLFFKIKHLHCCSSPGSNAASAASSFLILYYSIFKKQCNK